MLDLQKSCSHLIQWLGTRIVIPVLATRVTHPIIPTILTRFHEDMYVRSGDLSRGVCDLESESVVTDFQVL